VARAKHPLRALRRIPPVFSPIEPVAAARALLLGRRSASAPARLEALLGERYDADAVVLCGSGTQALQLALAFARDASGRSRALLPAYTCYDLVSAAVGADVRPTFYDIDPETLDPERDSLATALRQRPAAVVLVHHFGLPGPIEQVLDAAHPSTWVIEDAAQAHGGQWSGRRLGSLAPLAVLSFGRGKGWTGGSGGALLLRGEAAAAADDVRRSLAPPVSTMPGVVGLGAQWLLARPSLYALPTALPLGLGETRYVQPSPPAAMTDAAIRLVLANGRQSEAEIPRRRANARRLRARLEKVPDLVLPLERGSPGYLRLPLRIPGRPAAQVAAGPAKRLGLVAGYPRALPTLEAAREGQAAAPPTPGAETLARELFTAPTHSLLKEQDLQRIADWLRSRSRSRGTEGGH
jgi:dTDP-4-amino-4,6-dideoxygalactose transaminase